MKKITAISTLGLALFISISAYGGGYDRGQGQGQGQGQRQGQGQGHWKGQGHGKGSGGGANIQYLKSNHGSYTQLNNEKTPAPVKDENALTIQWIVSGKTEENATKLYSHINFMTNKLKEGKTPRAWDKLFLLEAYMKTSHRYTTDLSIQGATNVLITKTATDRCAYKVISAHSDAVSGDFFARGVLNVDHSSIAESIINSSDCASSKVELEEYVKNNQKGKGKGH